MLLTLIALLSAVGLFLGMLLFLEIGRRIGAGRLASDPEGLPKGVSAAEAAVFGLLGLIVAFSFSGAASRFEDRRHLITQEANAIGTAYLRIALLPTDAQPAIRALFRRYADLRAVTYAKATDVELTTARLNEGAALQAEIWAKAVAAASKPGAPSHAMMLMVPALNDMFDITTTRAAATSNHPPVVVFLLLAGLSLIGSVLAGYSMSVNKGRSLLHAVAFSAMLSLAVYVIIDLEFPRLGLIRVDAADRLLMDLRQGMN